MNLDLFEDRYIYGVSYLVLHAYNCTHVYGLYVRSYDQNSMFCRYLGNDDRNMKLAFGFSLKFCKTLSTHIPGSRKNVP